MQALIEKFWVFGRWVIVPVSFVIAFLCLSGFVFTIYLSAAIGFKIPYQPSLSEYFSIGVTLLVPIASAFIDLIILISTIIIYILFALIFILSAFIATYYLCKYSILIVEYAGHLTTGNILYKDFYEKKLERLYNAMGGLEQNNALSAGCVACGAVSRVLAAVWRLVVLLGSVTVGGVLIAALLFGAFAATVESERYFDKLVEYPQRLLEAEESEAGPAETMESLSGRGLGISEVISLIKPNYMKEKVEFWRERFMKFVEKYNRLYANPRLIVINIGEGKYIRPTILISELDKYYILYDFIFDDRGSDNQIYPIILFEKSDVKYVIGTELQSTRTEASAGQRQNFRSLRDLLAAACGRDTLSDKVKWTDRSKLKQDLIGIMEGMNLNCGDSPPTESVADKESENSSLIFLSQNLESGSRQVDDAAKRVEEASRSISKLADEARLFLENNGKFEVELSNSLAKVHDALSTLDGTVANRGSTTFLRNEPRFFFSIVNDKDPSVVVRVSDGECSRLERWDHTAGIFFDYDRFRLGDPKTNDLVAKKGGPGEVWSLLEAVFERWGQEIVALRGAKRDPTLKPVVYLYGRASDEGRPGYNLDLSEMRALSVQGALRTFAQTSETWKAAGVNSDDIFAIATGEGDLVPGDRPSLPSMRRVDAEVCFTRELRGD